MTNYESDRERQRRNDDPEYRKRYNAMRAKYIRERRKEDPDFREQLNAATRRYRARRKRLAAAKEAASKAPPAASGSSDAV